MIGRSLAHYEITEKLGEGGMGEVYLATDSRLERRVALKVLPEELAGEPERLARFEREAKAVAALNHPNIVTVHSVEEADGIHFFTMEHVAGDPLSRLIPPEGMDLQQLFDVAISVVDALAEAHEHGVIHRDLKPSNIMVDTKGRPKILDFGLAKLRRPAPEEQISQLATATYQAEAMTQEGAVLGTYPYMSPEQVEGRSIDHRSDLFSLGVVLYQMATGRMPFHGDSPVSIMSSILRDDPPEVAPEHSGLPHHLGQIISRCLEKDPEQRFQHAKDLRDELEDLRQEAQSSASSPRRRERSGRRSWNASRLAAAATLLILVIVAVAYWASRAGPFGQPAPIVTSLAVLPLQLLSDDPEEEYFADGLTEALIADLGGISALRVISRQSVMRYKSSEKSLPEIAEELGVEALIAGSVLPAGDRVRITAQLIKADPESQLWADTYERDTRDVLALLREVTQAIVSEVRVAVSPEEQARLARVRQVDPEAQRAYLRGRHFANLGSLDGFKKALAEFRQATELDPEYAPAWVGVADVQSHFLFWLSSIDDEDKRIAAYSEMKAALEEALELDPELSSAHALTANNLFLLEWDWSGAEAAFRRAIELNANDSRARLDYANFLNAMGQHNEASRQLDLAEQIEPSIALGGIIRADVHYFLREYDEAILQCRSALEVNPWNMRLRGQLASALWAVGNEDEIVEIWQQIQNLAGNYGLAQSYEGLSLLEVNRIWLDRVERGIASVGADPAYIAQIYLMTDNHDKALEWLEAAYAAKERPGRFSSALMPFLNVDPIHDALRSDPRFQDLLRRMKLAD